MHLIGRCLLIVGLILALFAGVPAQKRKTKKVIVRGEIATVSAAPSMPPDVQRRYGAFMEVWLTIRDNYFDATFSNLNWDAIRTEYEPKVKAAHSDTELHDILNAMIGRLNRSHLAVVPPEVYQAIEIAKREVRAKEKQDTTTPLLSDDSDDDADEKEVDVDDPSAQFGIGVDLSLIGDRFVITRMDPNSAAEYVGLKPGYVIDKVNGVSLTDMLSRIQIYYAAISKTHIKQHIPAEVVAWMLNGAKDTFVNVGYIDENEQAKEVRVRREPLKEKAVVILPNFPPIR
jgi:C-terminal processing protease CtpA/Prc